MCARMVLVKVCRLFFVSVWALGVPHDLVPQKLKKGGSCCWVGIAIVIGQGLPDLPWTETGRPRVPCVDSQQLRPGTKKHILAFCSIYGQWTTRPECTCLATPKRRRFGQASWSCIFALVIPCLRGIADGTFTRSVKAMAVTNQSGGKRPSEVTKQFQV